MHRRLNIGARARRRRDERGLAAVMIAISLTALLVASGMVLDFGLVRVDRQVNKSAADSAAMAGAHGLYNGNSNAYSYAGVCTAIRYLQNSGARFASVSDTSGTWTDGTGAAAGNGCTSAALQSQICSATNLATWAKYTWNGTYQTTGLKVVIQSGYVISGFAEDSLASAVADSSDGKGGCDQLAVTITENRKPGVGSIARTADLVSTVRSVARTAAKPTGDVPAMLLLKRSGCPTVSVGSTAGNSWIKVFGSISANGTRNQPGSIHSDANGSSCSNSVFYGKAADGIVAYAAPKIGAPTTADTTKPGLISSVAATLGLSSVDSTNNVYGTSVLSGAGTKNGVVPRPLVSRSIVDSRYLSGVKSAINGAQSGVFNVISSTYSALGYQRVTCSGSGVVSSLPPLSSGDKLFVDCGNTKSIPTINAGTVAFAGSVSPSADISLPNATHVYIFGATPALDIGNNTSFSMNNNTTTLDSVTGNCKDGQSAQRAVLFVKTGDIKQTGGSLRLCNTTVYMMGGQNDGCVPSYNPATPDDIGPAPTQSPCTSGQGTGQVGTTGGNIDWTAPNQYDEILDGNGTPDPTKAAAWTSVDGPEDLALWDESAGTDSNPSYKFTGGGSFHIQGIFMVPNADSIALSGSANFVLKNAQFVATSLTLASNNTTLSMTVDPNSGIALQKLTPVGLVR